MLSLSQLLKQLLLELLDGIWCSQRKPSLIEKKKERPSLDPFNDQTIYHLICRGDVGSPVRAIANLTKKFLSQLKRWLLNFARQISYCAFRELGNNSYVQRASKILPTEERPLHNHGSSKNQVKAVLQGWKVPLSRKMKKCIEIV